MVGPIENKDKLNYLSLADVFILPSKNEGFAIVFIEALAAGLPVIAPDKYGCPEGLLNGELGLNVDVDNKKMIAEKILSIFKRKIPKKLLDKDYLKTKTKQIYGRNRWNKEVKFFLK